jgi:phospholipase/lecithinase/hemolysin
VLDLRDFGARNLVMADHVHPTAFGQVAIAERALDVLAADGMTVRVRPRSLISYETTRWRRLRGDAAYAYRHAKVSARAAWIRARLAAGR